MIAKGPAEAAEVAAQASRPVGEHDPDVGLTTLPSGLRIVSQRMDHAVTVSLGIWIGAGARDELPHEHGLAHLLEHMAFKGTARRSAREIAEEIESVGGDLNAATSVEYTCYTARVLGQDLPLAVDILSDILTAPALTEEELAREKGVILQEIGAVQDTPDDLVYDRFLQAAFPDQPLGRPILGTAKTVKSFTPAAIQAYLARNYHAGNMVLAASGAVDHDELVALATERLAALPAGPKAPPDREGGHYRGGEARIEGDEEQVHLVLGFPGLPFRDGAHYPLQIFSSVLGGGLSSRLFQEVREQRGLAYSIDAFHWPFSDCGVFGISAGTAPEDVGELVEVALACLRQAAEDVTEAEVARARAQMKVGLLASLESPGGKLEQMARQVLVFGRAIPREELAQRLDAVTLDDVRAAGRSLLGQEPTIAAVGPLGGLPPAEWLRQTVRLEA
ncbi:insulinase family protein [Bosea caraganae]|uniref:Insulinase family protein n=1 Tax=Bosea caraganae TaxID=2763117 RepID=A0A370L4L3_9HYPH|nr:pitrilysin family protein [Bosea caraganae]RDJ23635.1 insulinase family protein [Bosea caraganae]RDJ24451.1 insulinase family protein [Bosea caraganae]